LCLSVSTYFAPLTAAHVYAFILFQILVGAVLVFFLFSKFGSHIFDLDFEQAFDYWLLLAAVSVFSLWFLRRVYLGLPYRSVCAGVSVFETELGFSQSLLTGPNRRRPHFFSFVNPLNFNSSFEGPTAALCFLAACSALGGSYSEVSIVMCFMNILATTAFLYFIAIDFTSHRFSFVLCVLFHGAWAFFLFFFTSNQSDLIHNIHSSRTVPFAQLFSHFLSLSKSHSASIPLAILSLGFAEAEDSPANFLVFGGFLAALIPEFLTSFLVFGVGSCFPDCIWTFLPFMVSLLPKFGNLHVQLVPLWREWQMDGIFFSPVLIWVESFGFAFLALFYAFFVPQRPHIFHQFVAKFAGFLFACCMRDGQDYSANAVAIQCVFLPQLTLMFVKLCFNIGSRYRSQRLKSALLTVGVFAMGVYVIGGFLSLYRTANSEQTFVDPSAWVILENHVRAIDPESVVLCRPMLCRIAAYFGKQIVIGNWTTVWKTGQSRIGCGNHQRD
jgi:hypothetical protein